MKEMPTLGKLYNQQKDKAYFVVIGKSSGGNHNGAKTLEIGLSRGKKLKRKKQTMN